MKLAGRVALVTGAARGIGRALCREFARRGAAGIAVADLDQRSIPRARRVDWRLPAT